MFRTFVSRRAANFICRLPGGIYRYHKLIYEAKTTCRCCCLQATFPFNIIQNSINILRALRENVKLRSFYIDLAIVRLMQKHLNTETPRFDIFRTAVTLTQ